MSEEATHTRHFYRRSRGRPGPNPGRILHYLGVRDLREHLERKRSQTDQGELVKEPEEVAPQKPKHRGQVRSTYVNSRRGGAASRDIENPLNITVEFSTATGQHVYKLDEETVLPTIKHVPDRRDNRRGSFRGRFRGRGRGPRGRGAAHAPREEEPPVEAAEIEEAETPEETPDEAALISQVTNLKLGE